MNSEELLSQVGLFRGLNQKHLTHLARCMTVERFESGQVIIRQGEAGQALYIVASGSVEVRRERPGDEPLVLNTLGKGQFFGEMALLDDYPRSATIVTREPTECLTLWKGHFLVELNGHPDIAVPMLFEVSRRLRGTLQQLEAQA
jgi:CRP/FNR family cyclic AMP-dependent transcriptional regulator